MQQYAIVCNSTQHQQQFTTSTNTATTAQTPFNHDLAKKKQLSNPIFPSSNQLNAITQHPSPPHTSPPACPAFPLTLPTRDIHTYIYTPTQHPHASFPSTAFPSPAPASAPHRTKAQHQAQQHMDMQSPQHLLCGGCGHARSAGAVFRSTRRQNAQCRNGEGREYRWQGEGRDTRWYKKRYKGRGKKAMF